MKRCGFCKINAIITETGFCHICNRAVNKVPLVFREHLKLEGLDFNKSYFFYGKAGAMKSQTAANLLVTRGSGKWVNVPELLHNIRSSYDKKGEERVDYVKEISELPWVCLDDLGVDNATDWVFQTLYVIINSRYENMLPTVITSNLSLDQLSEQLEDDRLVSRISGMCEIVKMDGKDMRAKK